MEVLEKVKGLIEPKARERKYYIVDITYKREGGRLVLRITLDKEGGIAMDECARFNNELSELLDKESVINDRYVLEVSSPGLDRKLKKDSDFVWALGKNVRVSTYGPVNGRNTFSGRLLGLGVNTVVIDEGGNSTEIPRDLISKAQVIPDIDWSKV